MPTALTYPGVYIEEVPSGVRPIAGVSTSDTAFVGYFSRGPLNTPTKVTSAPEAERLFGTPLANSEAALQLTAFFVNGGSVAWVVRVASGTAAELTRSTEEFPAGATTALTVTAASEGRWGDAIHVIIDHGVTPPAGGAASDYFNLTLEERVVRTTTDFDVVSAETHRNITLDPAKPRYAVDLVNHDSQLVTIARNATSTARPDVTAAGTPVPLTGGLDGLLPDSAAWTAGVNALDAVAPEVFNLLCLAGASELGLTGSLTAPLYKALVDASAQYCTAHRAFLVVDPPSTVDRFDQMNTYRGGADYPVTSTNAAMYFPRITVPDPLTGGLPREIGPCGSVAGALARTDGARGIWKAPAGTDVPISGNLMASLDDVRTGTLNVAGVNVIRSFPIFGTVVWGARTMKGSDRDASEWKYVPVRRLALYIEESLYQGLAWVVFEPNDEPLWSSIRLNVGAFMNGLFRQGAFAGVTTRDAYFVRCDKNTTIQADVDRGIVNILVGFKPLKPAEFVVLKIQQIAGQAGT